MIVIIIMQSELWMKVANEFCTNINRELSDDTNAVSNFQKRSIHCNGNSSFTFSYFWQKIVKEVLGNDAREQHIYLAATKWCRRRFAQFRSDERRKVITTLVYIATYSQILNRFWDWNHMSNIATSPHRS